MGSAIEKNPMMRESREISGCSHIETIASEMSAIISESGISVVLKSITAIASKIIVTAYICIAVSVKPKCHMLAVANNALVISIIGYRSDIRALQSRHFPIRISQLKTGKRSYHLII